MLKTCFLLGLLGDINFVRQRYTVFVSFFSNLACFLLLLLLDRKTTCLCSLVIFRVGAKKTLMSGLKDIKKHLRKFRIFSYTDHRGN